MTPNENRETIVREVRPGGLSRLEAVLSVATVLALTACALLAVNAHTTSANMAMMREQPRPTRQY